MGDAARTSYIPRTLERTLRRAAREFPVVVLTGPAVTESLAGRAAVLRLLPMSWREMARDPDRSLPWERARTHQQAASYVQTYLERDVRSLRRVGDLTEFQRFLRAVAARSAQFLYRVPRVRATLPLEPNDSGPPPRSPATILTAIGWRQA